MLRLIRAEAIKLTTTRTATGLIVGAAGVASLGAFSTIMSASRDSLGRSVHQQDFFVLASINLALFTLVIGIRAFTDEFRHGSIVPTFLVAPARSKVLVAKLVVYGAAGAVLAAAAQAVMLVTAAVALQVKGADLSFTATDVAATAGLAAAGAVWAAIGVAVGGIVRHQVGAIVGALVWVLLLENLGAGFLGDAGRYLPGQAAHALARASQAGTLLAPAAGALVLVAYALLSAGAAAARLSRADISAG